MYYWLSENTADFADFETEFLSRYNKSLFHDDKIH